MILQASSCMTSNALNAVTNLPATYCIIIPMSCLSARSVFFRVSMTSDWLCIGRTHRPEPARRYHRHHFATPSLHKALSTLTTLGLPTPSRICCGDSSYLRTLINIRRAKSSAKSQLDGKPSSPALGQRACLTCAGLALTFP